MCAVALIRLNVHYITISRVEHQPLSLNNHFRLHSSPRRCFLGTITTSTILLLYPPSRPFFLHSPYSSSIHTSECIYYMLQCEIYNCQPKSLFNAHSTRYSLSLSLSHSRFDYQLFMIWLSMFSSPLKYQWDVSIFYVLLSYAVLFRIVLAQWRKSALQANYTSSYDCLSGFSKHWSLYLSLHNISLPSSPFYCDRMCVYQGDSYYFTIHESQMDVISSER